MNRSARKLIPTNLRHQTKEFFNNSTLHGVRYIAEKGRPFGEKFMWFCCVAIGAVAAFVIIDSLWEKFQTNPTITGIVREEFLLRNALYRSFSSSNGWFRPRHRLPQPSARISDGFNLSPGSVRWRKSQRDGLPNSGGLRGQLRRLRSTAGDAAATILRHRRHRLRIDQQYEGDIR